MKIIFLKLLIFYKKYSPFGVISQYFFGKSQICRFSPTCSEYSYQAVKRYGIIKGTFLGIVRIFRCNPWFKAGYDPLK